MRHCCWVGDNKPVSGLVVDYAVDTTITHSETTRHPLMLNAAVEIQWGYTDCQSAFSRHLSWRIDGMEWTYVHGIHCCRCCHSPVDSTRSISFDSDDSRRLHVWGVSGSDTVQVDDRWSIHRDHWQMSRDGLTTDPRLVPVRLSYTARIHCWLTTPSTAKGSYCDVAESSEFCSLRLADVGSIDTRCWTLYAATVDTPYSSEWLRSAQMHQQLLNAVWVFWSSIAGVSDASTNLD